MDLIDDEKMPQNIDDNIIVIFTPTEYDYIKTLLHENFKLLSHFPKSKRTPNYYLFENILHTKFDL